MFQKFAAIFLALALMAGATVLALAKGWGLHPVSYAWILGMQVGVPFLVQVMLHCVFDDSGCDRCGAGDAQQNARKASGSDDSGEEP